MNQLPKAIHPRASNRSMLSVIPTLLTLAASAVALLTCPETVSAGLITDVSYQRELRFDPDISSQPYQTGPSFAGISLPVDHTLAIVGDGVSIAAHYSFTDNGSAAEFRVDCTSSFTSSNAAFAEVSDPANDQFPITFTTTQPLRYFMTANSIGNAVVAAEIDGPGGGGIDTRFVATVSGLLEGNTFYRVIEGQFGGPGGSSISSFDLVLTPVPEPASIVLLALGAAVLLLQRLFHRHVPINPVAHHDLQNRPPGTRSTRRDSAGNPTIPSNSCAFPLTGACG